MKRLSCIAALCLLAVGAAAQTLVTTPVMGFLTLNLQPGTNFMGFALLPSMEIQGLVNISGSDRARIFLQGGPQIALTNDQFSAGALPTHAVEIVSAGTGLGFTSPIVDTLATNNEIVLADTVPAGVADGATIKVWKLWTLAEVFGAANSAGLTGAETPEQADLIQLPNGSGFDQYFYSTGGVQGQGWRQVGQGTANKANVPLEFNGGFAIRARAAKAVVIVGQVKPGATRVNLQPGNNFVANMCPVNAGGTTPSAEGRTLNNSGLQQALQGGTASPQADLVLLWNGQGYNQFYYSTGGLTGTGWRQIGAGAADKSATPLPDGAYVILRRGAATSIQINQGTF